MEHEKLTEKIIGCAYRVYNRLEVQLVNYIIAIGKPSRLNT